MLMARKIYQRASFLSSKKPIGNKYIHNSRDLFTYKVFHPYDDEALELAILASYKQIYGNINPMYSERSIEAERRLRNGDITIREFVRSLSKSGFYRYHFFEKINQKRCIELNFMHFLGRPLIDESEFQENINLMSSKGLRAQVDSLINSIEYEEYFGENVVPFQRCWNSPCGATPASFINTASYRKYFPSSDNVN